MAPIAAPPTPPPVRMAWSVWGLAALFYLMGLFHRVSPAVMTAELMREFQISAGALGNLAAFYFYSYVAMQIPTGIMADTWGPRRLLGTGALIAAAGTVVFGCASSFLWAGIGRLLIGGSVAVAFVGMLKLATCWFPPRFYAMISGMAVLIGNIGAIFAGAPLRLAMNQFGWRSAMLAVAGITFCVGLAIWFFVRDYPHEKGYADLVPLARAPGPPSLKGILAGIAAVLRYRNTLLLLVIPGSMAGTVLTFSGLWGVPYLTTHYNLAPSRAALMTSALLVALAVGSPVAGWLSDRWGRRKPLFIGGCAFTLASFGMVLWVPGLPLGVLTAALLAAGLSASTLILTFAMAKESVPGPLAGTISGVINMGVMFGPMVLQPAVGWMLDRKWQGGMAAGVRIYGLDAYRSGFAIMLAWLALSLVLLFFTRETHCRQMK